MPVYRVYFLGEDDHIRAAEEIEAESVEEAVRQSRAMLKERPQHRAIEVWREARRIYPQSSSAGKARRLPAGGS